MPEWTSHACISQRSLWITGTIARRHACVLPRPILKGSESPGPVHALSTSISRRVARAASGFGGRRPAGAAEKGRARMEGALSLQQGEDSLLLRQRPENGVVRFLL